MKKPSKGGFVGLTEAMGMGLVELGKVDFLGIIED